MSVSCSLRQLLPCKLPEGFSADLLSRWARDGLHPLLRRRAACQSGVDRPVTEPVFVFLGPDSGLRRLAGAVEPSEIDVILPAAAELRLQHVRRGAVCNGEAQLRHHQTVQRFRVRGAEDPARPQSELFRSLRHRLHQRGLPAARAALEDQQLVDGRIGLQTPVFGTEALRRVSPQKTSVNQWNSSLFFQMDTQNQSMRRTLETCVIPNNFV